MENKKMNNGINEIRKIVMTDAEKKHIYDNILNSPVEPKLIKSPWFSYSFVLSVNRTRLAYYVIIPLLFIISGGGVVFASQDSLPDSVLYPLKVKVVEPIEGVLKFSAKAKAVHESSLASKRLVEAETLAKENKLDIAKEKEINTLLTKHTEALNSALNKVNNSKEDTDLITTDFRAEMNAHARVLDILNKDKKNIKDKEGEDSNKIEDAIIANTARVSANRIKNIQDKQSDNKTEKYKIKKIEVESLIGSADQAIVSKDLNKKREENPVIEDTKKTIDQARVYLDNADNQNKEGNMNEAYSSLLDSESSVKEAKIFFDASFKINKNRGDNHRDKSNKEEDNH